ncbi:hypothetical protein Q9966_010446 [Columba livia]|nr:hypothetical protein Q9966_010446 [Columba livia]
MKERSAVPADFESHQCGPSHLEPIFHDRYQNKISVSAEDVHIANHSDWRGPGESSLRTEASDRLNPAPLGCRVQSRTSGAGSAVAETFKIGFVYFVLFSLFLLAALVKHC